MSETRRSPLYGRLYWSEEQMERSRTVNALFRTAHGSCIGRLEDGTEVEYNFLLSDDTAPEPEGDYTFLGWGEYIKACRAFLPETKTLEEIELQILNCRFTPESIKGDAYAVSNIAYHLQQYETPKPYRNAGKDREAKP